MSEFSQDCGFCGRTYGEAVVHTPAECRMVLSSLLETVTAERDQARKTSAFNKDNHLAAEAEIARLKAQVETEHECAGEMQEGLSRQFRESAEELDALDKKLKDANLQVGELKAELLRSALFKTLAESTCEQNELLRGKIRTYGGHLETCVRRRTLCPEEACDCGFYKLKQDLGAALKPSEPRSPYTPNTDYPGKPVAEKRKCGCPEAGHVEECQVVCYLHGEKKPCWPCAKTR